MSTYAHSQHEWLMLHDLRLVLTLAQFHLETQHLRNLCAADARSGKDCALLASITVKALF